MSTFASRSHGLFRFKTRLVGVKKTTNKTTSDDVTRRKRLDVRPNAAGSHVLGPAAVVAAVVVAMARAVAASIGGGKLARRRPIRI